MWITLFGTAMGLLFIVFGGSLIFTNHHMVVLFGYGWSIGYIVSSIFAAGDIALGLYLIYYSWKSR